MTARLVLAGNVIVDIVMRVPHLPERAGDVLASHAEHVVGGGFNVLAAARRLGLPALYTGVHGTGPFGDRVRAALAAEGVAVALPAHPTRDTGFCVALIDAEGERTFVTAPGSESTLGPEDTAAVTRALRPGDLVQLSGYGLAQPGTAARLTDFATGLSSGIALSCDPGPLVGDIDTEHLARVLERCDWLSCNRREAEVMTGLSHGPDAATSLLARMRPDAGVLVRADADGCWLAAGGRDPVHVPGRPVEALDSNGAGDAHVGAFLALIGRGATPLQAARGANVAASIAVTRYGPATGPTRAELVAALADDDSLRHLLTT